MPTVVDHELQRQELAATVLEAIARSGLENTTLRTVAAQRQFLGAAIDSLRH